MALHSTEYIENRISDDEADALSIEGWLENPASPLPWSAWEWLYEWAHENPDAWPLVKRLGEFGTVEAAKLAMVNRVPFEARFNPYHAKDGKFASGNGMGSWAGMSTQDARAEQAELNMGEYGGITENQARLLADRQIPEGMRVYASPYGRTFVHKDADVDEEHLGMMFKDFDGLEKRFPTQGRVVINVQPRYKFTDKSLGETYIGKPVFRLSDDMVMGRNIKFDSDHTFHPAGFYSNPRKNLIAHEYGHAIDTKDVGIWKTERFNLSRYGSGYNAYEGFAEAFSDYITTPKDKWMKGTAHYVAKFGWEGK